MASTSSTHTDIHTPLSPHSSPLGPKVIGESLRPRPPWPSSQRKISHAPETTPPKAGGSPQSHPFFHPSFSNHAKLSRMLETLRMGVIRLASIAQWYAGMGLARGRLARKPRLVSSRSEDVPPGGT